MVMDAEDAHTHVTSEHNATPQHNSKGSSPTSEELHHDDPHQFPPVNGGRARRTGNRAESDLSTPLKRKRGESASSSPYVPLSDGFSSGEEQFPPQPPQSGCPPESLRLTDVPPIIFPLKRKRGRPPKNRTAVSTENPADTATVDLADLPFETRSDLSSDSVLGKRRSAYRPVEASGLTRSLPIRTTASSSGSPNTPNLTIKITTQSRSGPPGNSDSAKRKRGRPPTKHLSLSDKPTAKRRIESNEQSVSTPLVSLRERRPVTHADDGERLQIGRATRSTVESSTTFQSRVRPPLRSSHGPSTAPSTPAPSAPRPRGRPRGRPRLPRAVSHEEITARLKELGEQHPRLADKAAKLLEVADLHDSTARELYFILSDYSMARFDPGLAKVDNSEPITQFLQNKSLWADLNNSFVTGSSSRIPVDRNDPLGRLRTDLARAQPKIVDDESPVREEIIPEVDPEAEKRLHEFLESFILIDEETDITREEAKRRVIDDAIIFNRIADMHSRGVLVGIDFDDLQPDPDPPRDHPSIHDSLFEEMITVSKQFRDFHAWKINASKRIAKMISKYWEFKGTEEERSMKKEAQRMRKMAKFIGNAVKHRWNIVRRVVLSRHKRYLEQQQEEAGKKYLDAIVDHSTRVLSVQQAFRAQSASVDEGEDDADDDEPVFESASEEEGSESESLAAEPDSEFDETGDVEESDDPIASSSDDDMEVQALEEEKEMPIEQLLERYGYLTAEGPQNMVNRDGSLNASDDSSKTESAKGDSSPSVSEDDETKSSEADDDFATAGDPSIVDSHVEEEDAALEAEMEAEEEEVQSQDELKALEDEADMPIEELMKRYQVDADPQHERDESDADDIASNSSFADMDDNRGSESILPDNEYVNDGSHSDNESLAQSDHPYNTTTEASSSQAHNGGGGNETSDEREGCSEHTNVRKSTPVPFLLKHTLREYQQGGLDWLVSLYRSGLNGILADEMGLGKTIQTIALLAHLACDLGIWGPHLIVVPTSVMLNWEFEFKKWCPGFKILTYYGNQKERREKRVGWSKNNSFHVCITSYQLVLQDHVMFRRKHWGYLILDEAHNIKNFRSQRWQTLLTFNTDRRLLLTGTPLQNNLMELWSLLYFLMPGGMSAAMPAGFASQKDFQEWFSNPVDKVLEGGDDAMDEQSRATINKLHTVLRPYLLRRLKVDVEKQMPAKHEHVVYCRLSRRQRFLYDDFMSRAKTKEDLASGNYMSIINCLMQLRKVCNHPDLFEVRPVITAFVMKSVILEFVKSLAYFILVERDWIQKHRRGRVNLYFLNLSFNLTPYFDESHQLGYTVARLYGLRDAVSDILAFRDEIVAQMNDIENRNSLCAESLDGLEVRSHLYSDLKAHAESIKFRRLRARVEKLDQQAYVSRMNVSRLTEGPTMIGWGPGSALGVMRALRTLGRPPLGLEDCPDGISLGSALADIVSPYRRWEDVDIIAEVDRFGMVAAKAKAEVPEDYYCTLLDFGLGVPDRSIYPEDLTCLRPKDFIREIARLGVVQRWARGLKRHSRAAGNRRLTVPLWSAESSPGMQMSLDLMHLGYTKLSVAFPDKRLLQYDCGKLQTLDTLLKTLKVDGHRVLIFTQMARVLDILEIFLNFHGHRYLRLDGATKVEHRQILMERFNSDKKIFVFILSTRSGGIGMNLTGADTVIFYDSDWNPAMDAQAQDRAHRIGQTRDVHIYRLISEHTIEENMLRKANQKRRLDNIVISGGEFTTDYVNRVNWRDWLDDPVEVEVDALQTSGNDSPSSTTPKAISEGEMEAAMAAAEDESDVRAMQIAQSELDLDRMDFSAVAVTASANTPGGEAGDGAEEGGADQTMVIGTASPSRAESVNPQDADSPTGEADRSIGDISDYCFRFMLWETGLDSVLHISDFDEGESNVRKKGLQDIDGRGRDNEGEDDY
ncbi:SNF2 family N-terminal domain-containing protein [Cladochytrium replicatum]|nr:SNF2 family N-terminal domain-containing protein [Cladochytrium replicatum]